MSDNPPPLDVLSPLDVYVGYANTTIKHAASQFPSPGSSLPAYFPDPWANSHNVMYDGKAWPQFFDSGCVRIDNANPQAVTIGSITVDLPGTECSDYGCRPVHFDRWPRNKVIPPGCKWIITEMEGIPDLFPPAPFPNAVAVTVTATDADGHPINGVVFAVFAGDTHVGSAITFGNGSATVNFVPTAAETYSLSAICDGVKSSPIILTVVLPAAVYTAASITAIAAGSSGELYIRWAGLPNPGLCGSNN